MTRHIQILARWALFVIAFSIPLSSSAGEFKHKYLTLDLPDNWKSASVPAGSPNTIGVLKASNMNGVSITVDCYQGGVQTRTIARIRGLKTLTAVYPAGNEQVTKEKKIKTRGGKVKYETWRGFVNAGKLRVSLISPMATGKVGKCWLVMIGYAPEAASKKLNRDFLTIVKSAR